jgi:hypothetical protein
MAPIAFNGKPATEDPCCRELISGRIADKDLRIAMDNGRMNSIHAVGFQSPIVNRHSSIS